MQGHERFEGMGAEEDDLTIHPCTQGLDVPAQLSLTRSECDPFLRTGDMTMARAAHADPDSTSHPCMQGAYTEADSVSKYDVRSNLFALRSTT